MLHSTSLHLCIVHLVQNRSVCTFVLYSKLLDWTGLYFGVLLKDAGVLARCRLSYRSRAAAKPNTAGVLLY